MRYLIDENTPILATSGNCSSLPCLERLFLSAYAGISGASTPMAFEWHHLIYESARCCVFRKDGKEITVAAENVDRHCGTERHRQVLGFAG